MTPLARSRCHRPVHNPILCRNLLVTLHARHHRHGEFRLVTRHLVAFAALVLRVWLVLRDDLRRSRLRRTAAAAPGKGVRRRVRIRNAVKPERQLLIVGLRHFHFASRPEQRRQDRRQQRRHGRNPQAPPQAAGALWRRSRIPACLASMFYGFIGHAISANSSGDCGSCRGRSYSSFLFDWRRCERTRVARSTTASPRAYRS